MANKKLVDAQAAKDTAEELGELKMIPLESLVPADDNPRHIVATDSDILSLALSMKEVGVRTPLSVEPHPFEDGSFRIKDGERRYTAAPLAGFTELPCHVQAVSETVRQSTFLVTQSQREALGPIEVAVGLKQMADAGASQREIADSTGISQGHISKLIKLLKLPAVARGWVQEGDLTQELAEIMAGLPKDAVATLCAGPVAPSDFDIRAARVHAEAAKRIADAEKAAKDAGLKVVIDADVWQQDRIDGEQTAVAVGGTYGTLAHVDKAEHAELDCHAVHIDTHGRTTPVCTEPDNHPAPEPPDTAPDALVVREVTPSFLAAQSAEESLLPSYRKAIAESKPFGEANPELVMSFVAPALFRDSDPWDTAELAVGMLELSGTTDDPLDDLCTVAEDEPAAALIAFAIRSYNRSLRDVVEAVVETTPFEVLEQESALAVGGARRLIGYLQAACPDDGIGSLEQIIEDFATVEGSDEVAPETVQSEMTFDQEDEATVESVDEDVAETFHDEGPTETGADASSPSSTDAEDAPAGGGDGTEAPVEPTVEVFPDPKARGGAPKFLRRCSVCGQLPGFSTSEKFAMDRAKAHITGSKTEPQCPSMGNNQEDAA